MTSSFLFIMGLRGKVDPICIPWTDDTLVLVMQEYLLRSSVKEAFFPVPTSESGRSAKILSAIDKRTVKLKASVGKKEIIPIVLPTGTPTWWHRYQALQPDCSEQDAFNDDYIASLHRILRSGGEGREGREDGTGTGSDSVISLVKQLQSHEQRQIVIIDCMDSSLLAAMWEMHRRECLRGDIFFTSSFYPVKGVSVQAVLAMLRERFAISSPVVMENMLFCLPLILHAGLPPLLMLQCTYKDDSLAIFMEAMSKASSPILRLGPKGETAIAVTPLVDVFASLAAVEEKMVQQIDERCREQTDETAFRDFCGAKRVGWDQFRQYYYFTTPTSSPSIDSTQCRASIEEEVRKRVIAYLAGLLQLSSVYRGHATPVVEGEASPFLDIRMDDAPLVADLLVALERRRSKGLFLGLPLRKEWRCGEAPQKRRTLGRLKPLFTQSFVV